MATPAGNGAPGAPIPARPNGPPVPPRTAGAPGTAARPAATAPAPFAGPHAAAQPGALAAPGPGGAPAPRPRAVLATGVRARLAQATRTAPGRLRLAGVVLTVLTVAFGGLTAWQLETRAQAADRVVSYSQPLSRDAAEIHRNLADAATTAATGFLLAGAEPKEVRDRYEQDLATAAKLVAQAAARTTSTSPAQDSLARLNQQLPAYAGLVETARADNRQGIPLGGAYLRYASEQMQTVLLPTAAELAAVENQELADDYAAAESVPWAAYGLAALTLAALAWVQLTLFRRTNRVFNVGLLGATAAVLAGALWLTVTGLTISSALQQSEREGAGPLRALNSARVDVLTARLAENLHFVARGSTTKYVDQWAKATAHLAGSADLPPERSDGSLPQAVRLAPSAAQASVQEAAKQFDEWRTRHDAARAQETGNADYQGALDATVTAKPDAATADAAFNATDRALARAADIEQDHFTQAAVGTGGDLRTTAVAAALLGLVAAAAALRGLGRRLAEYR
ncbi:hypothetical protein BX285_4877 [Streptomyces sp. 1114.5]|uniref:hypothetical protein n=1 Tax=Streptomyces sp. 1114.5 TaxID=1938830 RepID=UPI000F196542|nr:hypothetical protein [Streptomyces sp. 1114.5]RKT10947.1 hypothetical protein BX285_4877 [Streptomyces sp. 1114.5]